MKICKTMYHVEREYDEPVCTKHQTEWGETYRYLTRNIEITIYKDARRGEVQYDIDTDDGEESYFIGNTEEIIPYEEFIDEYENAVDFFDSRLWVGKE